MYNDSTFDKDDWKGIISVCLSHKEQKTNKIGRYGQGFKSVFHLTGNMSESFHLWKLNLLYHQNISSLYRILISDFCMCIVLSVLIYKKSNQGNQGYSGNQKNVIQGQNVCVVSKRKILFVLRLSL